jgi:hypothetical protein
MRLKSYLSSVRVGLVVVLLLATLDAFLPGIAQASAELSQTMVRLDNMSASSATKGTVCVKGTTSTSTDYILVQFPSQFTLSTTLGNWTTTNSAPSGPGSGSLYWPSGASGFPQALTATNVNTGTNTVTFQYASAQNIGSSTLYCFDWTNAAAITSTGAAGVDLQGSVTTENASSVIEDIGEYALTILTSNSITVTAVVPPIFEFTMPATSDAFTSNLSPSAITTTTGVTPTIKTNAKGGWIMWAHDSNQALTSASSSGSIPSVGWNSNNPTTLTAGTAGYALNILKSVAGGTFCTETVDPEYDTVGHGSGNGGEFWSNWQQIGQCAGGPSNGDGLELQEEAAIAVTTPAATDYTDTIYVTGAGLF